MEAVATTTTINNDRSITSRPLLRIVMFSPWKQKNKKNITIGKNVTILLRVFTERMILNSMRVRINCFIRKDRCTLVRGKSGLAAKRQKGDDDDDAMVKSRLNRCITAATIHGGAGKNHLLIKCLDLAAICDYIFCSRDSTIRNIYIVRILTCKRVNEIKIKNVTIT